MLRRMLLVAVLLSAGCASSKLTADPVCAEAQSGRLSVVSSQSLSGQGSGPACGSVMIVFDNETEREYLIVRTVHGVAVTPMTK
jgi:hypothetical protein